MNKFQLYNTKMAAPTGSYTIPTEIILKAYKSSDKESFAVVRSSSQFNQARNSTKALEGMDSRVVPTFITGGTPSSKAAQMIRYKNDKAATGSSQRNEKQVHAYAKAVSFSLKLYGTF